MAVVLRSISSSVSAFVPFRIPWSNTLAVTPAPPIVASETATSNGGTLGRSLPRSPVGELGPLEEQIIAQQRRINELEKANAHLQNEVETAYAVGATTRTTTIDLVSMSDVRRTMEDLAAELYQLSAALADSRVRFSSQAQGVTLDPGRHEYMLNLLGTELANVFTESPQGIPDLVVEMAVQHSVVVWCCKAINSWGFQPFADKPNALLNRLLLVAENSAFTEDPGDVARWRAMTHRFIQTDATPELSDRRRMLPESIAHVIALVDPTFSVSSLEALMRDRITAICNLAFRLHSMIGTEILSETLEVTYTNPGSAFDPSTMENMWGPKQGGGDLSDVVVCTTSLGLVQKDLKGFRAPLTLVKAKVLVREDLKEICSRTRM
ncbi:hypothetical protein C8F01DRAFT_1232190 [Mycena amicta]|nr:hypothetical protein C8F01DRAFT_1232190 [Mycena amicta]